MRVWGLIYILVMACILSSCHTSKLTEKDSVYVYKHDTIAYYKERVVHDSVYMHDSVSQSYKIGNVVADVRVDTMFRETYRIKYICKKVVKNDTIYKALDSVEIEKRETVKEQLPWWKKLLSNWKIILILYLIVYIVIRLYHDKKGNL